MFVRLDMFSFLPKKDFQNEILYFIKITRSLKSPGPLIFKRTSHPRVMCLRLTHRQNAFTEY